jgi:Zn finger protein HypA/HybF involved in hydrogenase expression
VLSFELTCRNCQWRTVCGRDDAIARLKIVGLLRRDPDPDEDLIRALFADAAPRLTCPLCKQQRLHAVERDPLDATEDEEGWQSAVLCEICRKLIPSERVEALPGVKRCIACQGQSEAGISHEEPEFCPHCGSLVELRTTRGPGITRYRRFCTGMPPCRL